MSVDPAASPWLSLIGIGEDGLDGLDRAAKDALAQAELIVGGARHIALVGPTLQETFVWPSPLSDAIPVILARRGRPVVVLASGDPFHYGVGVTLAQHVPVAEIRSLPHPSAFALAANRLGWGQQDVALVSLHGRALERLIPHIQPNARILMLSWDHTTPAKVARLLTSRGCGLSMVTVLEAVGGPRERIRTSIADDFDLADINSLNTIAVHIVGSKRTRYLPRAPGLPDDWFEHDGQLTKRPIRAMTLATLAPRRGELLWDVGAGSGSIAIEWMLADTHNQAIAIEANLERIARIGRNARALGVPDLTTVAGEAPAALAGLPMPDAIFLGGGATDAGVIETAWERLRPGGRLVANAVTLETQSLLIDWRQRIGGELTQLAVSEVQSIGSFTGWRPARPIVEWRVEKQHG